MSVSEGARIYTGPWIDYSRGVVLGSTITLENRSGAVLTAFLAFYVTVIGACLWRLLCFLFHQLSASPDAKDGMYHQHQLIFRNTSSPTEAIRAFAENAFFWRKNVPRPWIRSLPLAVFAIAFTVAFSVGSILTSLVTKAAGDSRLVVSDNCGFWSPDTPTDSRTAILSQQAKNRKDLNDTMVAAYYARQCYGGNYKNNKLSCNQFVVPVIPWNGVKDVDCPFDPSVCAAKAFKMDTGIIDSHTVLGINAPMSGRAGFRKITTCAPLKTTGNFETVQVTADGPYAGMGQVGDTLNIYGFGSFPVIGYNFSYLYNQHAFSDGFGYQLEVLRAPLGEENGWVPNDELKRNDADISLVFLAPNSIQFLAPVEDPFFKATTKIELEVGGLDQSFYGTDEYVNAMACTDQYQYCKLDGDKKCTPLTGYYQALTELMNLGMDDAQEAVAIRISYYTSGMSIYNSIGGRGAQALRAIETTQQLTQSALPPTQWQVEASSWFAVGLAKLQRSIVEYASGPAIVGANAHVDPPNSPLTQKMCKTQKVASEADSLSFSVLGIGIIIVLGAFIILVYLVAETVTGWFQKRYHWGDHRRLRWIMDDKMQVQRMAFEEAGMGQWENLSSNVPVTKKGELFGSLGHVDPHLPRLGTKWADMKIPTEGPTNIYPPISTGTDSRPASHGYTGVLPGSPKEKAGAEVYQKPLYQPSP